MSANDPSLKKKHGGFGEREREKKRFNVISLQSLGGE